MTQKTFSVIESINPIFIIILLLFLQSPLHSHEGPSNQSVLLRFIHRQGEILHADALVEESVYIDGYYSHDAQISETSVTRILEVDNEGTALLQAEFRTDEWIVGYPGYREWLSEEIVLLDRTTDGRLSVPETASRPVLRDIPVFPTEPVHPGDSWHADAQEVHFFRIGGVVHGPYRGDMAVSYEYIDDFWNDDVHLARLSLSYDMYIPVRGTNEPIRLVSGRSNQILLWDIDGGRPYSKSEEFEFLMLTSDGRTQEFRGHQVVEYRLLSSLDREEAAERIRDNLGHEKSILVEPADRGIRLILQDKSLNSVLFLPESAEISSNQRARLAALSETLADYPERDILISGHTALFGNAEGRQRLSTERAAAVAESLFPEGRQGPGKLYIRGLGAQEPIGSDSENRRVEILILD